MIKALLFDCFGVLYPDTYWTIASKHLGSDYSGREQELHDLVKRVDLGHITVTTSGKSSVLSSVNQRPRSMKSSKQWAGSTKSLRFYRINEVRV